MVETGVAATPAVGVAWTVPGVAWASLAETVFTGKGACSSAVAWAGATSAGVLEADRVQAAKVRLKIRISKRLAVLFFMMGSPPEAASLRIISTSIIIQLFWRKHVLFEDANSVWYAMLCLRRV
jgi:hypothetical protein